MDFVLSLAARQDLLDIWDYIARDSLKAADRVRDDLFTAMQRLAEMPNMGHLREDLIDEPLRFWRVHSYLILYRFESKPIEIVRVLNASRDIEALLRHPEESDG
jgi:plasmid stabilization system protein ParE